MNRRKPRLVPLRLYVETAELLADALGERIQEYAGFVLFSYRCATCKAIVEITVGDCLQSPAA